MAGVGTAAGRLGNLVGLLPPSRWTGHLGLSPGELLAAALASEWALPLLPGWAHSTLLHHDAAFASAFLQLWQEELPALHRIADGVRSGREQDDDRRRGVGLLGASGL